MKTQRILKFICAGMMLTATILGCGATTATEADTKTNNQGAINKMENIDKSQILIAYFSWSGNTKAVAEEIQKQTGGQLFAITPATPYSETYSVTVAKAKQEQLTNARPKLKTNVEDFDNYKVIFLGYPNWWGSMPMPVATFIESHNWQGKTIIPFYTHGGGGVQNCNEDLRKILKDSSIMPYLLLAGSNVKNSQAEISSWLGENFKQ